MPLDTRIIRQSVQDQRNFAERLFSELLAGSVDDQGVTRDTYGKGENFAHEWFANHAREMGLEVTSDSAANTYATWAGADRRHPRVIIGSHLDSVKRGGNFDGAAGVIAGLVSIAALHAGPAGLRYTCGLSKYGSWPGKESHVLSSSD